MKATLTLLAACALLAAHLHAADFLYSNKFDNIAAEVWLPGDAPVTRGLIVHAANYKLKPPPGVHAVHAIWESSNGQRGTVNPALIVIRGPRQP